MKLVTIQINGRLDYMVNFDKDSENEVFVLEHTQGALPLLSFYPYPTQDKGRKARRGKKAIFMFDKNDQQIFLKSSKVSKKAQGSTKIYEEYQLEITLTRTEPTEEKNELNDGFTFSWEQNEPTFKYEPTETGISLITVTVILEDKETNMNQQSFKLYVGEQYNIADVTLDFGSEASQMAAFCRAENLERRDILPLFKNMRDTLEEKPQKEDSETEKSTKDGVEEKAKEKDNIEEKSTKKEESEEKTKKEANKKEELTNTVKNEDFLQYDSSDPNLFKSHFFLKKEFPVNDFNTLRSTTEPNNTGILRMLCTEDEVANLRNQYLNVANVKISGFGGVEVPLVNIGGNMQPMTFDDVVYKACLNTFLYQALESVHAKNLIKEDDRKMQLLAIRMLMPNVYDHRKIYNTLKAAEAYIETVLQNHTFPSIIAVELSAVSESDASLIGLMQATNTQNNPYKNGNYLILDAGKGTLDFSVIEYENGKYSNRYRSGIIGSGNAISYAYVIAFVWEFLKTIPSISPNRPEQQEEKIRHFIYSVILGNDEKGQSNEGGDPKHLLDLMKAIDDYKIRANCQASNWENTTAMNEQTDINNVKLSQFVNWIQNYKKPLPSDCQSYVDCMIDKLVQDVCANLKAGLGSVIKVDYLAFTGRAFAMGKFQQKMQVALQDIFKRDKHKPTPIPFLLGDKQFKDMQLSLKNVCLYMYLALQNNSYNPRLMSEPFMLYSTSSQQKNTKNRLEEQTTAEKSKKSIIEFILGLFKKKETDNHNNPQPLAPTGSQLQPQGVTVIQALGYQSRYRDASQIQNVHRLGGEHNPFAYGFQLEEKSKDDWLCVGGTLYNMQTINHIHCGPFKLFYTGEHVSLFQNKTFIGVLPQRVDAIASNEFASMFPHGQVNAADNVVIPTKKEKLTESKNEVPVNNDGGSPVSNDNSETSVSAVINETENYMETK